MGFADLDKPSYQPVYEFIMKHELLKPGGMMLFDNVLYRGLVAQHQAEEMPEVSEGTAKNAAALDAFLAKVRADRDGGSVHTLMMPVKDGMLAVGHVQSFLSIPCCTWKSSHGVCSALDPESLLYLSNSLHLSGSHRQRFLYRGSKTSAVT